jgi:hypothetical protein
MLNYLMDLVHVRIMNLHGLGSVRASVAGSLDAGHCSRIPDIDWPPAGSGGANGTAILSPIHIRRTVLRSTLIENSSAGNVL